MPPFTLRVLRRGILLTTLLILSMQPANAEHGRLAYLVSDLRIPYWNILWRGIQHQAGSQGFSVEAYSAENDARRELQHAVRAINDHVDGIVLSPTNSSAAVTILKLAGKAGMPVVIADIGTDGGKYVSYVASDNFQGSYELGKLLVDALREKGWQDGRIGIIAIPQKRANGQARTAGFMKALAEAGIAGGDIRQQVDFSYRETYDYTQQLITENPDLRAIWLQGSDRYQGALDAIDRAGRQGQILLISFDAEPEFLDMIPAGMLVASGMQQPFLMGETAVAHLIDHLRGIAVPKKTLLPVLAISGKNIAYRLPEIRRNVLGLDVDQ